MNYLNLPYPMFTTTETEKELLRKCEFYLVETDDFISGLCRTLRQCATSYDLGNRIHIVLALQAKIRIHLKDNYLESLFKSDIYRDIYTLNDRQKARILVRRIWITKLLNYTEE